jgi:hypothetical protein
VASLEPAVHPAAAGATLADVDRNGITVIDRIQSRPYAAQSPLAPKSSCVG